MSQGKNPAPRDMRRHDRATVELPVVVTDTANRVVGGIRFASADVSPGGAFLRSDLLFEVGETLRVEFQLPTGRLIRATCKVVRVARDPGETRFPGMGMEFQDLDPADRQAIDDYLATRP